METSIDTRKKMKRSKKWSMIIGVVFILWNLFVIAHDFSIAKLQEQPVVYAFFASFVVAGAFLVRKSLRLGKVLDDYQIYSSMLQGRVEAQEVDYAAIAKIVGRNPSEVVKEVGELMKHGLWTDVYGGMEEVQRKINIDLESTIEVQCDTCKSISHVFIGNTDARCEFCRASLIKEIYRAKQERNSREG